MEIILDIFTGYEDDKVLFVSGHSACTMRWTSKASEALKWLQQGSQVEVVNELGKTLEVWG